MRFPLFARCMLLAAPLLYAGCSAPVTAAARSSDAVAAAELRAEAERTGSLRVVVMLAVPPQEAQSAEAIGATQDRLLGALDSTEYTLLRRYESMPAVALVVSAKGLEALLSSPLVSSVTRDGTRRPMSRPGL